MKLLVVDDSSAVRNGICALLQASFSGSAIGEAASAAEAIEKMGSDAWDAVILDISMPGGNGTGVLEWRKAAGVRVPVVMQSSDLGRAIIAQCLGLGAAAFVAKEALPDELVPAVHAIVRGEVYLCRVVIAAIGLLNIPSLTSFTAISRSKLNKLVTSRVRENLQKTSGRSQSLLQKSDALCQKSWKLLEGTGAFRLER